MELNPESEPLLNKEEREYDSYIKIRDLENKQKSKEQILNKNCYDPLEFIFFCCIDYDVTQRQYDNYIALRDKCIIPFEDGNQNHEKILQDYFQNIKKLLPNDDEEGYEIIDDKKNKENELDKNNDLIKQLSKRIGFQSDNPRTDFRAGGLFSLEFMNYFITNYKIESKNILSEHNFPFSIVCINLCFKICLILYLTEKEKNQKSLESANLKGCSRKEIKHFCEHLGNDNEKDLLFLIISQCLCFVFSKYMKEFDNIEIGQNIFNINSIINITLEYLKKTLNRVKKNENLVEKLKYELEQAKNVKIKNEGKSKLN